MQDDGTTVLFRHKKYTSLLTDEIFTSLMGNFSVLKLNIAYSLPRRLPFPLGKVKRRMVISRSCKVKQEPGGWCSRSRWLGKNQPTTSQASATHARNNRTAVGVWPGADFIFA